MSELHAAVGLVHLRHLSKFVAERNEIAQHYDAALADGPLRRAVVPEPCRSNYYKYVAFLPEGVDRNLLKQRLRETHGIGLSGEVYEVPLHLQPVFEGISARGSLPVAEEVCARHVCLPIFQGMSTDETSAVTAALRSALCPS
jgi:dTDP-4-amino-4,6-dideoxygalactose transaminase